MSRNRIQYRKIPCKDFVLIAVHAIRVETHAFNVNNDVSIKLQLRIAYTSMKIIERIKTSKSTQVLLKYRNISM